jgi:hypothetical protein
LKYPTILNGAGSVNGLVTSTANVLRQFNWTEAGFVYTDIDNNNAEHIPICKNYFKAVQASATTRLANISTYSRFANLKSVPEFQSILLSMKNRARVIVVCLENQQDRRNFMTAATLNKMIGADYVYMFVQTSAIELGILIKFIETFNIFQTK